MFLESNDFSVFIMVYRSRSVSKSAKLLGKSSATVSYLLKKMETQFARKLFERNYRELRPNAHAEALLPTAVKICAILRLTFESLQKEKDLGPEAYKNKIKQASDALFLEMDAMEDDDLIKALSSPLRIGQLIKINVLSRNRSVSATARELNISQPSLHTQLKELESLFGVPLFISQQKSTSLTDRGRLVNASAKLLLEQINMLDSFAKSQYYHAGTVLKFGTVPVSGTQSRLTKILTNFIDLWKHKDMSPLEIITDPAELLVHKLEDNAIDAAIIDTETKRSFLTYHELLHDELLLVTANLPDEDLSFQSLIKRYPLILLSQDTGIRRLIDRRFRDVGIDVTPAITINSIPLIMNLVRKKKWSTILPKSAFGEKTKNIHLSGLPTPITRKIHLAYRSDNSSSVSIQNLLKCFGVEP